MAEMELNKTPAFEQDPFGISNPVENGVVFTDLSGEQPYQLENNLNTNTNTNTDPLRITFGSSNGDVIKGAGKDDFLSGMAGADELKGQ